VRVGAAFGEQTASTGSTSPASASSTVSSFSTSSLMDKRFRFSSRDFSWPGVTVPLGGFSATVLATSGQGDISESLGLPSAVLSGANLRSRGLRELLEVEVHELVTSGYGE